MKSRNYVLAYRELLCFTTVRLRTACVVCIKTEDSNVCVCMLVVVSGVLCLREVSVCERDICF